MRTRPKRLALLLVAAVSGSLWCARAAHADDGFQLNRLEPPVAGSWFFGVDHPWYSSTRYFAGGVTFNYGEDPLVSANRDEKQAGCNGGTCFRDDQRIIDSHEILHVDLAGSFLDRLTVALSLPLTLNETGRTTNPDARNYGPSGFALGAPRIGVLARLFGQPDKEAFSMSLGVDGWIPVGTDTKTHAGDPGAKIRGRILLGGAASILRWAFNVGYLYRGDQDLHIKVTGMSVPGGPAHPPADAAADFLGQELQAALGIGIINPSHTFQIGPEVVFASELKSFFGSGYTSLEALLGVKYLIADTILIGAAGGMGFLHEPGTPNYRVLVNLAYAPMKRELPPPPPPPDTDGDGVPDPEDACPNVPGVRTTDPKTNGCPPPPPDRDHDGVPDSADLCPDEPQGDHPDPTKRGCPAKDRDGDGVFDYEDQCPDVPKGPHPDPKRLGCPDKDSDGDGVFDHDDLCPDVPAGLHPDPAKPGCPKPDRDHDSVPDEEDACPDQPGAPDPDPKKNGCPGLVKVENGLIVILNPVFFATNKDVILPKSNPVLTAVAKALKAQPQIKKLAVEGHTDNKGKPEKNMDLSQRRANSVMKWLVEKGGIEPDRLEAHGYGQERPVMPNTTDKGRAANRRVEFHITDPAPPNPEGGASGGGASTGGASTGAPEMAPAPDKPTGGKKPAPSSGKKPAPTGGKKPAPSGNE